jgi:hypothetical protein
MKLFTAALSLLVWLSLRPAPAAEVPDPLPILISTTHDAPPGCMVDTMIHIAIDTNKFVLRLPANYRMASSFSQHSIVLSRMDNVCKLAFRILASPGYASSGDPTTYRNWIYAEHPDAKILKEFTANSSNHGGPGFSLQWRRADGLVISELIAYIPCSVGVLEFSASSIVTYADQTSAEFQMFLLAFRAPINGKLETPYRFSQS